MHDNARDIIFAAFDQGVTHFDLANNYGPPPGSAEERFGRILKDDLASHRDELIISTKAGYDMWAGPYGNFGSRKYLLASLDQSLSGWAWTMSTSSTTTGRTSTRRWRRRSAHWIKPSKAARRSTRPSATTRRITSRRRWKSSAATAGPSRCCTSRSTTCSSDGSNGARGNGDSLIDTCGREGIGIIPFSPLEQGILTDKYIDGIPDDSRASKGLFLKKAYVEQRIGQVRELQTVARDRGQSLAQLALAWCLRDERVTSIIIGASRPSQVKECCGCLDAGPIDGETLERIEKILEA